MKSFGEPCRRHASDVYRVALWMCGNEAEAEDVTAETFARAWVGVDDLRFETAKAYHLTIARTLVRTNWRLRRVHEALDEN
jgi:RNA polymerase sigma-70 factor (ECF subfamily)